MRLLVVATCVAIIAFVGYFFWGEYSSYQAYLLKVEQNRRTALADYGDELASSGKCVKIATSLVDSQGKLAINDEEVAKACAWARNLTVYERTTLNRFGYTMPN